jgi:hypothetical protein
MWFAETHHRSRNFTAGPSKANRVRSCFLRLSEMRLWAPQRGEGVVHSPDPRSNNNGYTCLGSSPMSLVAPDRVRQGRPFLNLGGNEDPAKSHLAVEGKNNGDWPRRART